MAHINAKDFIGAAQVAEAWLSHCPVDASIHMWATAAYHEAGDQSHADVHDVWFKGLTDSALSSGDGASSKSPIVVISIKEEYAVLSRLGLDAEGQALTTGPPMLDVLHVKDKLGNERAVHFNPEWHFMRLAQKVKEAKP